MHQVFSLKRIVLTLFIVTSCFTLYSVFSKPAKFSNRLPYLDEKFEPDLLNINSCSRLDSIVAKKFKDSGYDTAKTVLLIDDFLRNRFYHSYSRLTLHDNWIASLCGTILWSHFAFPVLPCDIIKFPMAACSQQGIVFQQQLDQLKIPCSTIEFFPTTKGSSGHYAVSVYYGSSWHFYDSNQEPLIIDSMMPSVTTIIDKKLYERMYVRASNIRFQEFFKSRSYRRVNKEPFSKGNMYYFQTLTAFLSHWLWLFLLLAYALLLFKVTPVK
jgi:hypothetical protein